MSTRFPLDGIEELPIQIDCSQDQMREMLKRISVGWERMGQEEPYFNVLTDPKFIQAQFGGRNEEEFWRSGELGVERLVTWMRRNRVYPKPGTILEYGCGVGRITRWLKLYFDHVIGCDVSLTYLKLAGQVCSSNVRLMQVPSLEALYNLPQFDIVFSLIVLQHNPPPVIARILWNLLSHLNPHGIACFQLPTMMRGYTFDVQSYLDNPASGSLMEMHCLPQRHVFEIARSNGCAPLEVQQDDLTGCIDHVSTTFLFQKS